MALPNASKNAIDRAADTSRCDSVYLPTNTFLSQRSSRVEVAGSSSVAARAFPPQNDSKSPDFIAQNGIVNNLRTRVNRLLSSRRKTLTRTSPRDSERTMQVRCLHHWGRALVCEMFRNTLNFKAADRWSPGIFEVEARRSLAGWHQIIFLKTEPAVQGFVTNP